MTCRSLFLRNLFVLLDLVLAMIRDSVSLITESLIIAAQDQAIIIIIIIIIAFDEGERCLFTWFLPRGD